MLTAAQIAAIISLLIAFNISQITVNNVQNILLKKEVNQTSQNIQSGNVDLKIDGSDNSVLISPTGCQVEGVNTCGTATIAWNIQGIPYSSCSIDNAGTKLANLNAQTGSFSILLKNNIILFDSTRNADIYPVTISCSSGLRDTVNVVMDMSALTIKFKSLFNDLQSKCSMTGIPIGDAQNICASARTTIQQQLDALN